MICRNHPTEWETQKAGVKAAPAAQTLGEGLEFRIPCFLKDRLRDFVGLFPPCCDVFGKAEKFCDPGTAIQSHLAQPCGIRERTRCCTDFPYAVVRAAPLVCRRHDEVSQPGPQSRIDRSMILTPLIGAVENFTVNIVLNLIRCGIS